MRTGEGALDAFEKFDAEIVGKKGDDAGDGVGLFTGEALRQGMGRIVEFTGDGEYAGLGAGVDVVGAVVDGPGDCADPHASLLCHIVDGCCQTVLRPVAFYAAWEALARNPQ